MEPWEYCLVCPDWEACRDFGECIIDYEEEEEYEEYTEEEETT